MAQYEADKLVRLLQFCCWKARCSMDSKGFKVLSEKIEKNNREPSAQKPQLTPNERYFSDLLGELNAAIRKDNLVNKRDEYIDFLLNYAGFSQWPEWETALYAASEYVFADKLDLSAFSEMEMAVCLPALLEQHIYPDLAFIKRTTDYPVQLLSCKEEDILIQLQFVSERLNDFPFIVWAIPFAWKDQLPLLKDEAWDQLIASGRIVPVWIKESSLWETPFIPWLKHRQTMGGVSGLITSLLYLQDVVKKYHRPESAEEFPKPAARMQNFQNSRGTFILGDIKSENTAMGDLHQTIIHKYKKNKS